jgi:quinol monooxygenase YgiN
MTGSSCTADPEGGDHAENRAGFRTTSPHRLTVEVIVAHVSFKIDHPDRSAFDAWFGELCRRCRQQAGCVAYDYRLDPDQSDRGILIEVWDSDDAFDRFLGSEEHRELTEGRRSWRMEDVSIHRWRSAGGYRLLTLPNPEDTVPIFVSDTPRPIPETR